MPLTRWSRRHKKTFGKYDEEIWDGNFRQPPKPKSYYTKVKGQCRWCDKIIVNEDRKGALMKTASVVGIS